ncbi:MULTISPECIES: hypothetical protein [unclassified Ruegeria]|nr:MULTISPECIES: hypothetical protein [unclassified Ruegeria]
MTERRLSAADPGRSLRAGSIIAGILSQPCRWANKTNQAIW